GGRQGRRRRRGRRCGVVEPVQERHHLDGRPRAHPGLHVPPERDAGVLGEGSSHPEEAEADSSQGCSSPARGSRGPRTGPGGRPRHVQQGVVRRGGYLDGLRARRESDLRQGAQPGVRVAGVQDVRPRGRRPPGARRADRG
ncbi:unnamed protein product, partial [Ectocarpus fasciculatus]